MGIFLKVSIFEAFVIYGEKQCPLTHDECRFWFQRIEKVIYWIAPLNICKNMVKRYFLR